MNQIRIFRKKKKISQKELALIMMVNQNTISQWENDMRQPKIKQAIMLAKVLETTVEELYK
jgi:DNA-binding XRE family transcriptional regulator